MSEMEYIRAWKLGWKVEMEPHLVDVPLPPPTNVVCPPLLQSSTLSKIHAHKNGGLVECNAMQVGNLFGNASALVTRLFVYIKNLVKKHNTSNIPRNRFGIRNIGHDCSERGKNICLQRKARKLARVLCYNISHYA